MNSYKLNSAGISAISNWLKGFGLPSLMERKSLPGALRHIAEEQANTARLSAIIEMPESATRSGQPEVLALGPEYFDALDSSESVVNYKKPHVSPSGEQLYMMATDRFEGRFPWAMVSENGKASWSAAASDLLLSPDTILSRHAHLAVQEKDARAEKNLGLLRDARAILEALKDVEPAESLCSDIDKALAEESWPTSVIVSALK